MVMKNFIGDSSSELVSEIGLTGGGASSDEDDDSYHLDFLDCFVVFFTLFLVECFDDFTLFRDRGGLDFLVGSSSLEVELRSLFTAHFLDQGFSSSELVALSL